MIDIDKFEKLAEIAKSGLPGDRMMFAVHAIDPEGMLELIAEVRSLRAEVELCEKLLADCREAAFSEADNPYLGAAVGCPQDVPVFVSWEIERLRAALSTPLLTHIELPYGLDDLKYGADPARVEVAFAGCAKSVTIYYGEKRTYTSMAAFCAAHPKA